MKRLEGMVIIVDRVMKNVVGTQWSFRIEALWYSPGP